MRYRQLGDSGLTVSVVGLGCNNFGRVCDLDGTRAVVDAALESGITLFDTADIYARQDGSSEQLLGQVLGPRRHDVVLATKFGMDMKGINGADWDARGSRRYIRRAVETSLQRLQTDWIDLYQYHAPDGVTPMAETLAALHELVVEGKIRYLGSSNLAGWQIADADWTARSSGGSRFISAQNHYSLLEREVEAEVVPACEAYGVGLLPYFPLANGLLTGKYRLGQPLPEGARVTVIKPQLATDETLVVVEELITYAEERGVSLLDVAVGGLLAQPAVASVIAGATRPEQVRANVLAGQWAPSAEDLAALDLIVPSGSAA